MSLLEEVASLTVTRGPRCAAGRVADDLDPADQADLQALYDDPTVPSTLICRALQNRGLKIQYLSIQRHRRRDCACR